MELALLGNSMAISLSSNAPVQFVILQSISNLAAISLQSSDVSGEHKYLPFKAFQIPSHISLVMREIFDLPVQK